LQNQQENIEQKRKSKDSKVAVDLVAKIQILEKENSILKAANKYYQLRLMSDHKIEVDDLTA